MEYKGYTAAIEIDEDAELLHGNVLVEQDVVTFQGKTVAEARQNFQAAVDDYLDFCDSRGETASPPYTREPANEPTIAYFQQIDPPGRAPGRCWLASLYLDDNGTLTRPVALAWLSDFSPVLGMSLDYVLVPDQHRRLGYAKTLITACAKRWPNLELTDAISYEGLKLNESLEKTFSEAAE